MSISLEEVRHVAKLARLELEEAEIMSLQSELNALLNHLVEIQGMDLKGVETSSSMQMCNVWSEDGPGRCLSPEDALRNAPVSKAGLFVVPNILEG